MELPRPLTPQEIEVANGFKANAERHANSVGIYTDWSLQTLAEEADINLYDYPKEGVLVQALWVSLLSVMRKHIPAEKLKYPTVEEFKAAYDGFFDKHQSKDLTNLWNTANMMCVLFTLIPSKKNKGLAIAIIPKVVEGWYAKYVTGSGQTKATADRVKIFETEGQVLPNHRGKLMKPKKKSSPSSSRRSSMSSEAGSAARSKSAKRSQSKRKISSDWSADEDAPRPTRRRGSSSASGEKENLCNSIDMGFSSQYEPEKETPVRKALPKNVGVYNYLKDISRFNDYEPPSSPHSANDMTDNDQNDESAAEEEHEVVERREERSGTEDFDHELDLGNFLGLEEEPLGPAQDFHMEFDENDSDFVDVLSLLRSFSSNTNMATMRPSSAFQGQLSPRMASASPALGMSQGVQKPSDEEKNGVTFHVVPHEVPIESGGFLHIGASERMAPHKATAEVR